MWCRRLKRTNGMNRYFVQDIVPINLNHRKMQQIPKNIENVAYFFSFSICFLHKRSPFLYYIAYYAYHIQSARGHMQMMQINTHTHTLTRSHFISSSSDFQNFSIIDDEIFIWSIRIWR